MADTKISGLPASTTPLAGTEELPIVQSGVTKKVSVANLTAGRAISATELTLTTGNLIVSNGKGIDFSATPGTGTSELLADYEEGTWTPAVRGSSTAGTYELATATGTYTKVGNLVTVSCLIAAAASVTGGGAGYLQITGFPFANGASATGAVRLAGVAMTALYTWVVAAPISNSGTTTWYIEESGSAQNGSDLPISGFGVNDQIKITVTYRT